MKEKWLTLVLRITNLIYQRKQSEIGKQGWASIGNIIALTALEIALAAISLPLYLTTSTRKMTGFLEEKGGYSKIAVDYKLRRVLTLTGVGVIFLIWAIKFIILILTPQVYGPLRLYSVSDVGPVVLSSQQAAIQDTSMQTARVDNSLPVPTVMTVEKLWGNRYRFSGTGKAGDSVVVFLSGSQNLMYTDQVGNDGHWVIEHAQNDLRLSSGVHSIFVFNYEKDRGMRSQTSPENYFRINISFWEQISLNADNLANWSVVIIIILGVFLTLLTV